MSERTKPLKAIFIGGAPRSGTTVTHALLCTAPGANRFHGEVSFLSPLFECYKVGLDNWDVHTCQFFNDPERLKQHLRKHAQSSMVHIWTVLEKPSVLCLKDPLLTPNFSAVSAVLEWPTQFVTVLRHPHDVVRSQQEVYARGGVEMTEGEVYRLAHEYMRSYEHLDAPELEGRVFHFRYEDLGHDWLIEQLRKFTGLGAINPDRVWENGTYQLSDAEKVDPFYSPKLAGAIDTARRLEPLAHRFQQIVNSVCVRLMDRCGYLPNGAVETW